MTTSTITWIATSEALPEVPPHHMTTEELFLVKVEGKTRVAHIYAGRPIADKPDHWDFSEEAQSERHWLDVNVRGQWSERVIQSSVTEWARLPQ